MRLPIRVLVLCTANSARSQLAEALLRDRGQGRVDVESAGATPAESVHPGAIRVLSEHAVPIRDQRPKRTEEVLGLGWDVVITVCDQAREACPVLPEATLSVHWSVEDPARAPGEAAAFEKAYEDLGRRVDELLKLSIEALDPQDLKKELDRLGA